MCDNNTDSDSHEQFSHLIDETDEFFTQRVEELMDAHGVGKAEARRMALYAMEDGSPLPLKVAEMCAPPEDWYHHDPGAVRADDCAICGDEVFMVETEESCYFCGGTEYCGVDDYGYQTHVEPVEDPAGIYANIDPDSEEWFICGGCYETFSDYGDTVVVIMPDGRRWKVDYQSPVIFDHGQHFRDYEYLDNGAVFDLVEGIVLGTGRVRTDGWRSHSEGPTDVDGVEVEAWDTFVEVGGGWHSTWDASDFSERINELTSGDIHPPFPMAVRFGKTSNLFSIIIDLYAPEGTEAEVKAFMDGATHAGLAGGIDYKAD